MLKLLTARFQKKKKIDEAISNPKGQQAKESPLVTRLQKFVTKTQLKNVQNELSEEEADLFATSNPKISGLNVRISRLKEILGKKKDPSKEKQLLALIAQQQRLESEEAKKRMRTASQSTSNKTTTQNQNNTKI